MNSEALEKLKDDAGRGIERLHGNVKASIQDALDAFDDGDFEKAGRLLNEAGGKLSLLGFTESKVASVGHGHIVKTRQIQEGMYVQAVGRILSAEEVTEPCESGRHEHTFIKLDIEGEDEPSYLPVDGEVVVVPESDTASNPA